MDWEFFYGICYVKGLIEFCCGYVVRVYEDWELGRDVEVIFV